MRAVPPLAGDLLLAPYARALAASDFGHLVRRMPLAVLRPGSVEDIAVMTRWASENGRQIAARGRGHSVYGRSQVADGIVVDMSAHNGIGLVEDNRVVVGAGATWRAVLSRTLPVHGTPPVLTDYLDLTVGGDPLRRRDRWDDPRARNADRQRARAGRGDRRREGRDVLVERELRAVRLRTRRARPDRDHHAGHPRPCSRSRSGAPLRPPVPGSGHRCSNRTGRSTTGSGPPVGDRIR
jgi:hypothetical protein